MAKKSQSPADHVSGQANKPLTKPAHALPYDTVVQETKANSQDGLTDSDAKSRLEEYGRNEFGDAKGVQPFKILLGQIANAMILVLIVAMAVSFAIQSWIEGGVIAGVIGLNVVVGFFQEFQAEKTMDSLRSLSSPTANAVRDGSTVNIPTAEVVPGDMIEMKTGDTIPADIRLIEAVNFETDEALLTGEALPVRKDADATFDDETGPGDRLNIAYSSSTVTKGRARGIVFATGMYTEIGSIAASLQAGNSKRRPVKGREDGTAKPHHYLQAWTLTFTDAIGRFLGVNVGTPLQQQLSRLAVGLFFVAVIFAVVVVAANYFANEQEVIIYAVATGLSMIPASLIVVLTITMAAGAKQMVKRNVIVRNMRALEALGAITDICSDKTGTITQGKMVAKKAWIPSKGTYSVNSTSEPQNPTVGDLAFDDRTPEASRSESTSAKASPAPSSPTNEKSGSSSSAEDLLNDNQPLEDFLTVAALANLATVHKSPNGEWHARGDPTEIAIQVFAARFKWNRRRWVQGDDAEWKQLAEFPFDSDVKRMSTLFEHVSDNNKKWVFTKGAVERIIQDCDQVNLIATKGPEPMTEEIREDILRQMNALASQGLRVLALASREFDGEFTPGEDMDRKAIEKDFTFRGLIGLYDPPRLESTGAVRECHDAGIMVHMLTGDHPGTASAIAKEVGILPPRMNTLGKELTDAMVMTATQFDKLSDEQIDALPMLPLVVARCAPNTKVRMIDALHRRKCFAAMTGDGVNDSPSLKRSDIGIAMGKTGSDVAKDASDIVLTDDNFASIINAIEEGRRAFDNIQKFILHLLAQNVAQALILLIGLVFKDESRFSVFPIAPVEIIWIIMVTSSAPDMGLGFEPAAKDIMKRKPHNLKKGVFTWEVIIDTFVYGIWIAALCLSAFVLVLYAFGNGDLGNNCNDTYSPSCDGVFRARATTFACLTWFSLFLAWEMMSMRRSFFLLNPDDKHVWTQWMRNVWRNKFLFWSVIAGFVTIFPILYIPVINHDVFRHTGISWEWAIVFIETILFFGGVEGWKWGKRVFFRRQEAKKSPAGGNTGSSAGKGDEMGPKVFERYYSGYSDVGKVAKEDV